MPSAQGAVGNTMGPAAAGSARSLERKPLGIVFILALVWILFDIGRPPTPSGVPLLISVLMCGAWLQLKDKQWAKYSPWWFAFLAVVAIGFPFAANNFAVFFSVRFFATLILMVCLPLQGLVNSVKRARAWSLAMVGIAFYVGFWALSHGGYGPASSNGQDENYVATLMGMGVAIAYFTMLGEKKIWVKLALCFAMFVFVGAMAVANNASRGGFLGLLAVAAYCIWRSPHKMVAIGALSAAGLALLALAGDAFWKEIDSTGDYKEGTSDVRLEIWAAGMRMWAGNPVIGVGAGNFRWVIGDYQTQAQVEKFGRSLGGSIIAHSTPVELVAELGTAGLLCALVLLVSTWRGLGRIRVKKRKPGDPPVTRELELLSFYADGIRAAMLAVLVSGAFLSLLYYSHIWVLIAVGSALPFIHARLVAEQQQGGTDALPQVTVHRRSPDFDPRTMLPPPSTTRSTALVPSRRRRS